MASNKNSLATLKRLLAETDLILSTTPLPENRTARCRELLSTALAITDDLIKQANTPAAILGRKGGKATAKRGSEYFRQIAAKRKTFAGGRPPKETE